MQVRMIIEILGRPASNVTEAISGLLKRLEGEKGVKIQEQTIHEPVVVKDAKDLFTTFAELIVEMDSMQVFFSIAFAYMPSHIEIISPETFEMRNEDLTTAANAIVLRLHEYDSIAKRLVVDRENLVRKLFELAPHLFKKSDGQPLDPQASQSQQQSGQSLEAQVSPVDSVKPKKEKKKSVKKTKKK